MPLLQLFRPLLSALTKTHLRAIVSAIALCAGGECLYKQLNSTAASTSAVSEDSFTSGAASADGSARPLSTSAKGERVRLSDFVGAFFSYSMGKVGQHFVDFGGFIHRANQPAKEAPIRSFFKQFSFSPKEAIRSKLPSLVSYINFSNL